MKKAARRTLWRPFLCPAYTPAGVVYPAGGKAETSNNQFAVTWPRISPGPLSSVYRVDIRYFPDGEPDDELDQRPIANLSLERQEGLAGDPSAAIQQVANANVLPPRTPLREPKLQAAQTPPTRQTRATLRTTRLQ